jgi:putative choline sulfate-utilization transcription factor
MGNLAAAPSLDLLRLFEAAARHRSFTLAAGELQMSQPAVSQHIQRLEKQLQARLFERAHRALELTAEGAILLEHVQAGLASINAGLELLADRRGQETLNVATDFAFATYRLIPKLHAFHQANPDIGVNLVTGCRGLPGTALDIDVAIAFGDGQIKHGESRQLFGEEVFAVCSAELGRQFAGQPLEQALSRLPLLHLKGMPGNPWCDWKALLKAFGMAGPPGTGALSFDNYPLLVQACIGGQGVAIGWRYLVDDLLDQGLLARLSERSHTTGMGYYVVRPARKRRSRLTQRFIDWLEREIC